jgi:hypothetical protein
VDSEKADDHADTTSVTEDNGHVKNGCGELSALSADAKHAFTRDDVSD